MNLSESTPFYSPASGGKEGETILGKLLGRVDIYVKLFVSVGARVPLPLPTQIGNLQQDKLSQL